MNAEVRDLATVVDAIAHAEEFLETAERLLAATPEDEPSSRS